MNLEATSDLYRLNPIFYKRDRVPPVVAPKEAPPQKQPRHVERLKVFLQARALGCDPIRDRLEKEANKRADAWLAKHRPGKTVSPHIRELCKSIGGPDSDLLSWYESIEIFDQKASEDEEEDDDPDPVGGIIKQM